MNKKRLMELAGVSTEHMQLSEEHPRTDHEITNADTESLRTNARSFAEEIVEGLYQLEPELTNQQMVELAQKVLDMIGEEIRQNYVTDDNVGN